MEIGTLGESVYSCRGKGGSRHFGLGGCTVADPEIYKNPNTSRGVWGHDPPEIFDIFML